MTPRRVALLVAAGVLLYGVAIAIVATSEHAGTGVVVIAAISGG